MEEGILQDFGSKKEKYHFHNYLTVIVKALENHHTIVDLRNESCAIGLIKHVDGLMNIEMESVQFYDALGRVHKFQDFFISARNIRYVHIPEGLSATELMNDQLAKLRPEKAKKSKKDSFKSKRAKKYNAEVLQSAYEAQPGPSGAK